MRIKGNQVRLRPRRGQCPYDAVMVVSGHRDPSAVLASALHRIFIERQQSVPGKSGLAESLELQLLPAPAQEDDPLRARPLQPTGAEVVLSH